MSQVPDPSFWQWIFEHLWIPILGVATWLFNRHIDRIEKIAEDAMPRDEFDGYSERSEKSRDEIRANIIKLFDMFAQHNEEDRRRHEEIMSEIHRNHTQLLVALGAKLDK